MTTFRKFAFLTAMISASCTSQYAEADKAHSSSCSHCHHYHKQACKPPIRIENVPIKITKSGNYCVDRELKYKGSGAAIEVCADNVTIDFNNNSLKLKNPAATGILAKDIDELTILNDRLSFTAPFETITGSLIRLETVNKATLDNLFLFNASIGLLSVGSSDIHLINCQIRECNGAHVVASDSNGFVIDNCNFYNTKNDTLSLAGTLWSGVVNGRMTNSQLFNSDIFAPQITGFTIDNVTSTISDSDYIYGIVQLGSLAESNNAANDCIVRNSQFIKVNATSNAAGVLLVHGSDILFENNLVTSDSADDVGLILGDGDATDIRNVKLLNSLFTGATSHNVAVAVGGEGTASGIEIADCVMQGARVANLAFSAHEGAVNQIVGCAVKDNTIQNGLGDGILTNSRSITGCSFLENLIANNCGRAIYLAEDCTDNLIAANKAFRNGHDFINDGTNNLLDDNTEFNNKLKCEGEKPVATRSKVKINLTHKSKTHSL